MHNENPWDVTEWRVAWRPSWPEMGDCPVTGTYHPMHRFNNYWHCAACFIHFHVDELPNVQGYSSYGEQFVSDPVRQN